LYTKNFKKIPPLQNIYYFHGFDGFLTQEKRKLLEPFGNVIAPTYNYRDPKTLKEIKESFYEKDLNDSVFIGTSFGGYVANYFSTIYDKPNLLFNPALLFRTLKMGLDAPLASNLKSLSYFVLGEKDRLLSCSDNIGFINQNIKGPKEIIIEKQMGHHIPTDIFGKHVSLFLK
jgi:predicted esterase YcpF (UPF0227 family)